jgi:hypothetical protein
MDIILSARAANVAWLGRVAQASHHQSAALAGLRAASAARPQARMHTFLELAPAVRPFASSPVSGAYSPAQIQTAYGFNKIASVSYGAPAGSNLLPGYGQTIAIVDAYDDPNIAGDLATFDSKYGIPAPPSLTKINQNGSTSGLPGRDRTGGWEMEETLDVEWAHAIAPGASIVLVEARSSGTGDLLTAVQAAAKYPGVGVVSMSWGGGEMANDGSFTTPSGHTPVTFVASSGDNGAPISWPAVSPNVLAVGGTSLKLDANNAWAGESGWSGSGGGISNGSEAQPSYQQGVVTQSTTLRANPDVAYDADPGPGFSIYDSVAYYGRTYNWTAVGGTSAGAPQWAALVAIADQGRGALANALTSTPAQATVTSSGTNLAQSILYGLFSTAGYNSSYFHDITTGTSTGSPNYSAQPNYDLVTGLGTPRADGIVAALVNPPPPAPLTPPANLSATADPAGPIALSWSSVPGATAYNVYLVNGTTPTLLFTTSATSAEHTGVTPGQSYTYEVVATNAAQSSQFSQPSNTVMAATGNILFSDGFNDSTKAASWTLDSAVAGAWQRDDTTSHTLSQTNNSTAADPQKAVITGLSTIPSSVMISAQFAVTAWKTGEFARVGVGLDSNVAAGSGLSQAAGAGFNIVIRDDRSGGQHDLLQFLDDGVAWGNSITYPITVPTSSSPGLTWYNIQMESRGGVLYASIWPVGGTQPATWMIAQAGWTDRTGGDPALNGSSEGTFTNQTFSGASASFTNVVVTGG